MSRSAQAVDGVREIHGVLLRSGRDSNKTPGESRHSQVWIGGSRPGNTRLVPPPTDRVVECTGAREKFLHADPVQTPALLKAALAHAEVPDEFRTSGLDGMAEHVR